MKKSSAFDIHQAVTDNIIAAIERGVGEWKMPWHQGNGLSLLTRNIGGHRYSGINVIGLFASAINKNYGTNVWGSFRQLQENGLQVRKGERASIIVFYKSIEVDADPEREDDDGTRRIIKYHSVFNVEQCEGWVPPEPPEPMPPFQKLAHVERVFAATGANIVIGGDKAAYNRVTDTVHMPDVARFIGDEQQRREAFYASASHELVHWSGASHRLNREKGQKFGDVLYAREELVAETGAAMLCAELGISPVIREAHAECKHPVKAA